MNKVLILFFFCLLLVSCNKGTKTLYFKRQSNIVQNCRDAWVYKDLPQKEVITVIYYAPDAEESGGFGSNFMIGITKDGDTIALLDRNYRGEVEPTMTIIPSKWSADEKEKLSMFVVGSKRKFNKMLCDVTVVYYAQIANID